MGRVTVEHAPVSEHAETIPSRAPFAGTTRAGITLFVALSLANASNYLFHVIISRLLGPSDYGALTALLSAFLILSIPAGAVQVTIARMVAARGEDRQSAGGLLASANRQIAFLGIGVAVLIAALSPVIAGFLHLPSMVAALMLAAYAVPTFPAAVFQGGLQGSLRFNRLAVAVVASTLARIVVGLMFVNLGFGVTGAAAASVVAQLLLACLSWALLKPLVPSLAVRDRVPVLKECAWSAVGLTGFWVMVSLDTIMARHYLSRYDSGLYGAAATLSHLVLFAPGAIAIVALPKFAALAKDRRRLRESVVGTATLVLFIGAVAALGIGVLPELAIRILFGASYVDAAPMVRLLAASMVLLGMATIFLYYHLAVRSRAAFVFWGAAAAEMLVFAFAHESGMVIAGVLFATACAVVMVQATTIPLNPPMESLESELWRLPAPELDLTVVTPAHNGAGFLPETLARLDKTLRESGLRYEIVVVSDGSTDGTPEVVRSLGGDLRLVDYEQRQGKGEALRRGMRLARGEYIAFIDSDGDLHPANLAHFVTVVRAFNADIVLGSKRHPMSQVHYPPLRRLMSLAYQMLIRVLFGLKVRDTQTGMKVVRREALANVLPRMLEKRFAFDLELLVVAKRCGYRRFFEAPVTLEYRFESTVSLGAVLHILLETAAIWYRRFVLRSYDGDARMVP